MHTVIFIHSKEIKKFFSRYSVNSTNTTGTPQSSKPLGGGTGSKTSGTTPISKPKPTPTPLSNADAEARAWALENPNDPRAKKIMKMQMQRQELGQRKTQTILEQKKL
jgi:hypothetical protein